MVKKLHDRWAETIFYGMSRIITLLTPSPIIFRSFIIYCIEAIMGALGLYGIRKMASQRLNQSERSISMDLDQ